MAKAMWNGTVLAESDVFEEVEGNVYFPPGSIRAEFFTASATETTCASKGVANYFDIVVDGKTNKDGAWYYSNPKKAAAHIKNHVAFRHGVNVER